ncbi:hypothetical protein TTHERM_01073510 (macronuclear) [Tetrahymena thermophila SB210]|uniref:Uncharacterized protein n=1 Tax=Tetrahymena thermophila (strain SB210) TaxID=312017 RepID=Q24FN7_TETTS|nr:hypothetical protein TTHERM_01073510 [Tetrahymena thermophila SB210]EAS06607.3 hypothetical protein TTHERM_01073510 [Tetrahymena thermophila SB210]|eukprot:XP_001026852.3 hypothetical protein TTHERM_01073510 [Tetrahymena thermophila SB210]
MRQQQQPLQQNDWLALNQPQILQPLQNSYNYSNFNQFSSIENELLKQKLVQYEKELSLYKKREQEMLYYSQSNQYMAHAPVISQLQHQFPQIASLGQQQQQSQQFNQGPLVQMQNYQLQQQQQLQLQQYLQQYQNNIQLQQQNAQQNYINKLAQQQNMLDQQPNFQKNSNQMYSPQNQALQNNVSFSNNLQNLTSNSQHASSFNFLGNESQSSNKSTVHADDNSQQITLNFISQVNENTLSPKTNTSDARKIMKIKITKSFSGVSEEERVDTRQKSSKEINSLQKNNSLSSSDEDVEAGNELKSNNSSANSPNQLNKRTRCLYEPLFRIISPILPEKKSYKKNIIKYLISYQQGKQQQNDKSDRFTALLEENNSKRLANYITELLQSCKMAQSKKNDIFAHEYIADRICKSFQRKQLKSKLQSN